MDNQKDQKDIANKSVNSYGHLDTPAIKSLVNKPIYAYVSKKTEKIVTALYMVTDYMDTSDALKNKIRSLSVDLLSDMYRLSASSPLDNHTHISSSLTLIHEILSLVEVAYTVGYISDMNTAILKKELNLLIEQLQPKQTVDNPFTFTLDNAMFDVELPRVNRPENILENTSIKDKRTQNNLSYKNDNMSFIKRLSPTNHSNMSKEERAIKILNLIKEKKSLPGNDSGVSIKDISIGFTDYSEKTIQRELNSLVSKGTIKKIGAKRWSRYQSI